MDGSDNMQTTASRTAAGAAEAQATGAQTALSEEDRSKDGFFQQTAELAEAMIAAHGKDFAIGTLVLAAKFIAEGKPLINRSNAKGEAADPTKAA
jgi:hypothetical protein